MDDDNVHELPTRPPTGEDIEEARTIEAERLVNGFACQLVPGNLWVLSGVDDSSRISVHVVPADMTLEQALRVTQSGHPDD